CFFVFFQAEDGIRGFHVTGVQTCALPISPLAGRCRGGRGALGARRPVAPAAPPARVLRRGPGRGHGHALPGPGSGAFHQRDRGPANVFDDPEPWRQALLAHPLVADARIERRLPGTIILRITETEPVALARTPELMPVDATGRVLPIDPAAQSIDLPVLNVASAVGDDGRLAEPAAISMLAAYERIRRFEPALAARVSEILPAHGGGLRLLLSDPPLAEVLLPADFGAIGLRQVQLALSDLGARDELPRVRRIDVRFRDQVVVSLSQRPNR